jgi:hypothetical protein
MADIYQQIWDADQHGNGVRPFFDDKPVLDSDQTTGFVKINSQLHNNSSSDLRVLPEAVIPASKMLTYELCKQLFENYALPERRTEVETQQEREEVHDFVDGIVDTPPMLVARQYVEQQTGTSISKSRWHTTLLEMWFRTFEQAGDPTLSGFEHVLVGEMQGGDVQGYHFWWKYYLDDGFASQVDGTRPRFPGLRDDRIKYRHSAEGSGQLAFPESVTISYSWDAPDFDEMKIKQLVKQTGGFFVGCSPEGLMALGTIRAHVAANAPKQAVINGARYDLQMHLSDDRKNLRTFFPMYKGAAVVVPDDHPRPGRPDGEPAEPSEPVVGGPVKIVSALINPIGPDEGKELITLINMTSAEIPLRGWRVVDKNRNALTLDTETIPGGSSTTIHLPTHGVQLSNQGGEIKLLNPNGDLVHRVSYSRNQAQREGVTLVF